MRQSNVCSPAQNQACLLITSRLYDRRGLDCTSPLPLFNSLAHLVHLTATSPKIREILTRDGGLERLVRILREFVQNPPPVQDPGIFYGLFPPIPVGSGNGNVATAIASLNPSAGPPPHYHQHYQHHQFFGAGPGGMVDANHNPALVLDPTYPPSLRPPHHHHLQPHATHLQPPPHSQSSQQQQDQRPFDRDAAQRFSLAFQSIVNVGVRGSESIRSRVVEAGTLEVVSTVLEAWLVGKGFPLVLPRRGKKREVGSASSAEARAVASNNSVDMASASAAEDADERMDEDPYDEPSSMPNRSVSQLRSRNSTVTPHSHGRTASGSRVRPGSSSAANAPSAPRSTGSGTRPSISNSTTVAASSSAAGTSSITNSQIPRPSSSRNGNNQMTPRRTLTSLGAGQSIPGSSDSIINTNTSASLATPLDTPPVNSASTQQPFPTTGADEIDNGGVVVRGRSGTIIGQRVRASAGAIATSRANSTDDMDVSGSGRSGANTEDEDMEGESSNNENDESVSAANTSTEAVNNVGVAVAGGEGMGTSRTIHRPVAVADPQALSPHVHSESLSNQPGPGMGIGMEVDVLAAVNMVMAHEGVAAFEGTQFGGEAANAAAAEAMARAGREGIVMEEETPRAMLRNMTERAGSTNPGELAQVDEEMGDGTTTDANPESRNGNETANSNPATAGGALPQIGATPFEDGVTVNLRDEVHVTLGTDMSPLGMGGDRGMTIMDTQPTMPMAALPAPPQAGAQPQAGGIAAGQAQQRSPAQGRARATPTTGPGGAATTTPANPVAVANADRFKVAHGDAGPFRQEDVLRSLQLLAYLTKYPHVRQEFYKKRAHVPVQSLDTRNQASSSMHPSASSSSMKQPLGPTLAQVAPVTAALAAGQVPQITTLFSLVERFTFRPSMSHLSLHPNLQIPTIPPEIQSWAAVIMRNACRKDDTQGGIRQCANMTCGKWERTPREFAKCRRCRKAKYCGKECQSKAWSMGHRYWCSVREGTEPGQVPPENLDPENDDGSSTVVGVATDQTTTGTAGANTRGMGISITPGGGVGLVPLNQAPGAPHHHAPRGRTAIAPTITTTAFPPPPQLPNPHPFPNRGPVIMNAGGYAWDANTLPTTTAPPPMATNVTTTANTSTPSTSANATTRRREQTPTGTTAPSASAFSTTARERFTRGLSERLRVFQGSTPAPAANTSTTPSNNAEASTSSSSTSPAAPTTGTVDASRPRAWDRLFGRDAQPGSAPANGSDGNGPTGGRNGLSEESTNPSERPVETGSATRGYLSLGSRSSSRQGRIVQNQGQGQTDLSGMVRNNLVLAQQQQQSTNAALAGQWWRVAGSGPGAAGADDMGVD